MKSAKATVAHVKNNLSRYLAYVSRGGRVTIFKRDAPVAELIPPSATGSQEPEITDHVRRLEREGILRRGRGRVPDEILKPPLGKPSGVLDALLEERAAGR